MQPPRAPTVVSNRPCGADRWSSVYMALVMVKIFMLNPHCSNMNTGLRKIANSKTYRNYFVFEAECIGIRLEGKQWENNRPFKCCKKLNSTHMSLERN